MVALALCGLPFDVLASTENAADLGAPRDVSFEGHAITGFINVTMGFLVVLFVVMVTWAAISTVRNHRSQAAEYDHSAARQQIAIALSISAAFFFLVDGGQRADLVETVDHVDHHVAERAIACLQCETSKDSPPTEPCAACEAAAESSVGTVDSGRLSVEDAADGLDGVTQKWADSDDYQKAQYGYK